MERRPPLFLTYFVLPLFLTAVSLERATGFVAERIMAIVNNEVIALSDVREYAALFGDAAGADQKMVLYEIIGQKVFLAEAQKMEIPRPTLAEAREVYPDFVTKIGGVEKVTAIKKRLGISEDKIIRMLRTRLYIEKLLDQRLRSFVFVTPRDIRTYLQENPGAVSRLPQEEQKKAAEKAVRKIKSQKKMDKYLERLKARSDIQVNFPRK